MDAFDFSLIWAVIIGFGLMMYVLMDGFDLGVGILYPLSHSEAERDLMMNSVAPVWDGNETWLVLGGAGLLAAFPLVYSVFLPALYIPIFLMLAGLIFRGVAFEFRFKAKKSKKVWNLAFSAGSFLAAWSQGAVVGAFIQGFALQDKVFVGGPFDWLSWFSVFTGFALVLGYALLGATWLVMKTEGDLQQWLQRLTPKLVWAILGVFLVVSVWTPMIEPVIAERWFAGVSLLWLLPIAALLSALTILYAIKTGHQILPFLASLGVFLFAYLGLLLSRWPIIVPPDYDLWQAASAPESQLFLLLGFLFVIPIVLAYTAWTYWVFRGKVSSQGYH